MAITIREREGDRSITYTGGTKWVIDDEGRLHVIGPNGNLASYAAGVWSTAFWSAVHEVDPVEHKTAASLDISLINPPSSAEELHRAAMVNLKESRTPY